MKTPATLRFFVFFKKMGLLLQSFCVLCFLLYFVDHFLEFSTLTGRTAMPVSKLLVFLQ